MRWRQELHNEMNLCHGALVLFSRDVVGADGVPASDFCKVEASVLFHRKETAQRPFPLVPVVLHDVASESLRQGIWSNLDVRAFQGLRGARRTNAAEIAAQAVERFADLKQQLPATPLQRVERRIAKLLQDVEPEVLEEAAASLGPLAEAWDGRTEAHEELATLLLRSDIEGAYRALAALASDVDGADLEEIYYLLAPTWVDYRAAIRLRAEVGPPAKARGVAIGGREIDFTPRMYVRRADCTTRSFGWRVQEVPHKPSDDPASYYETRVRRALLAMAGLGEVEGTPEALDARILDWLDAAKRLLSPVFVALEWPGPGPVILEELQARYGHVTFFLLSSRPADQEPELAQRAVAWLDPPLDPEEERRAKNLNDFIVGQLSP